MIKRIKKTGYGRFLLVVIVCLFFVSVTGFLDAYQRSNPAYTKHSGFDTGGSSINYEDRCESGQDFVVQVSPFGCQPSVVRSDLLEEQNVPVFCQLSASKLNPLIDVKAIESISFRGDYPEGVSGVGFHPAKAALGVDGDLNSPILENIGYSVIVLERQETEDDMPDYVKGNLTAKLKYDVENAFGVGRASLHLPELSESEWEDEKESYSFWNGRAALRAEGVDSQGARISVYEETTKRASFELEKGETSRKVTIPSLDCLARFDLKLEDLVNPDTRAKLLIGGDVYHVAEGEKFLKNKCSVRDIEKLGLYERVEVSCSEDEERSVFDLIVSPKIKIKINGKEKEVSLGERVEELSKDGKNFYVGYIGTFRDDNGNKIFDSTNKEDLVVYFYEKNSEQKTLETSEVKSIARDIDSRLRSFSDPFDLKDYKGVKYGDNDNDIGVEIIDFAEPVDRGLETYFDEDSGDYEEAEEYYESAKSDFQKVLESYPSETRDEYELDGEDVSIDYGEEAFAEQIKLEDSIGNKRTAAELCRKFRDRYSDSKLYSGEVESICEDSRLLSNSEISKKSVFIDNNVETINLDRIKEPKPEEYGIEIRVRMPNGDHEKYTLGKNQKIYLNQDKGDYIQLSSIKNSTSATLNVNLESSGEDTDNIEGGKTLGTTKQRSFGSDYSFSLMDVNLEKLAKVSVNPTIDNQHTEANFSFQIGIEKRGINLSTDKTKERIENLNESLKEWSEKNEKLGNLVEGLKKSCLAVGGFLTIKNLISGMDGEAVARQKVMRDEEGWNDYCSQKVGDGEYYSMNDCFNENSDKINSDVEKYKRVMDNQNLEEYEEGAEIETPFLRKFLGEKTIDDEKFMKNYASDAKENIEKSGIKDIDCGGDVKIEEEFFEEIKFDNWDNGAYTKSDLRDLEFYSMIYQENPDDERAKQKICEIYGNINSSLEADKEQREAEEEAKDKEALSDLDFGVLENEDTVRMTYSDKKASDEYEDIEKGEKIKGIVYEGERYIVTIKEGVSGSSPTVKEVYDTDGNLFEDDNDDHSENVEDIKDRLVFEKSNTEGHSYEYKSSNVNPREPVARFYEREPDEGMPAIVPFDKKNGWYAAMKQTLPGFGNKESYEESGRVSSFYICNVYENNREDNMKGDDKCHMVNLGTGQPYQMASFGNERDSKKLVEDAVKAIEQASRQRQKNPDLTSVRISTSRGEFTFKVGEPQADIPDVQCQDFMSPEDCNLLFNVCDPVVCPSSRCDFGGAYPVRDVIQSGIAGSLFLCLPNIKEDIYIPVCLSGLHAGIDGYISILESHRDCLQESLDSGKMIGICDEIYSVHLCDFFWRQTLPLAKMMVPKMLEFAAGDDVRGGGEYRNVQEAWDSAGESMDYFTDYYSADAYEAFETRATEAIKESVCKNYVSSNYPEGGDLADSLTNPDSPAQFHGRFDENSFTSTTNPPVSHYKVYYHIYAGKDSRTHYQVYLKGDESSFYKDTAVKRNVASGYISKGDYASETKDFTAPSGYKEMCINVNGQEECGFKEVSTSAGVDYVKDKYLEEQAGQKDIKTESECVSGKPSLYSGMNVNPQSVADEAVDPEISDRGLIRVCASESPGNNSDPLEGSEGQRWVDVGYCDDEDIRCWLDTESVEDNVDFENTENRTLSDLTNHTLDKLEKEGDYLTKEEAREELKDARESKPKETIEIISEVLDKLFWNEHKAEGLIERGKAYVELLKELLPDLDSGKESNGKDVEENTECVEICGEEGYEDGSSLDSADCAEGYELSDNGACCCKSSDEEDDESDEQESNRDENGDEGDENGDGNGDEEDPCTNDTCGHSVSTDGNIEVMSGSKCLTEVGEEVKKIAREIKDERESEINVDFDEKVKDDTGAESFECLVLQLVLQESCLAHCLYQKNQDDPLYCDGDIDKVVKGDDESSIGIMQINTDAHDLDDDELADFEENVKHGVNYLVDLYERHGIDNEGGTYRKYYDCKQKNYEGWEIALRHYNGWSPNNCDNGDKDYVENIIDKQDDIKTLFSKLCESENLDNNEIFSCNDFCKNKGFEKGQNNPSTQTDSCDDSWNSSELRQLEEGRACCCVN